MTDVELQITWTAFREGDRQARDILIVEYTPLVRLVATQLSSRMYSVEQDDLLSYGIFGLIAAMERFDDARDVKFETFAVPRIRGAMIDELRAADWEPRSVRDRRRAAHAAPASDPSVNLQPVVISPFDDHDESFFVDHAATTAVEFDVNSMRTRLVNAIEELPPRERVVLALYYYENLTLAEIGTVLGVTESRVSQLHTRAVTGLNASMSAA